MIQSSGVTQKKESSGVIPSAAPALLKEDSQRLERLIMLSPGKQNQNFTPARTPDFRDSVNPATPRKLGDKIKNP